MENPLQNLSQPFGLDGLEIAEIGQNHHGEPRAVRHVIDGAQLVFRPVEHAVGLYAGVLCAGHGEGRRPADLGAHFIVLRRGQRFRRVLDDSGDGVRAPALGDFAFQAVGQNPLQRVRHDVHAPGRDLVGGQGIGELRVDNAHIRAHIVSAEAALEPAVLICDDGALTHLAARARHGDYGEQRHVVFRHRRAHAHLPRVAAVRYAEADALGAVDD